MFGVYALVLRERSADRAFAAETARLGSEAGFVVERDRVRFQPVTAGEALGARVRVEEGLDGNELVVLDPPADLADGQRVRVKE